MHLANIVRNMNISNGKELKKKFNYNVRDLSVLQKYNISFKSDSIRVIVIFTQLDAIEL